MPVMDGFELCRRWKADGRLRSIPFVVYTATYTDAQDEAFALSVGADRFLLKPMGAEELAQAVLEALTSARGGSVPPAPGGARDEKEILKEYNEVLFRKLEGKVAQLETEVAARDRAEREVRSLNLDLEERVRQRTVELESANRELEAFSYSVAHDLRAPLRAIDGYSALLEDARLDMSTKECREHLARIRANVLKMATLIDRLLELSRMGRIELRRTRLDMTGLARTAFAQLATHEEVPRVDFRVAELPEAEGDAALVGQVFANLLSNALKFSSEREKQVIEVGSRDDGGRVFWFVRDNGAGFDMRFGGQALRGLPAASRRDRVPGRRGRPRNRPADRDPARRDRPGRGPGRRGRRVLLLRSEPAPPSVTLPARPGRKSERAVRRRWSRPAALSRSATTGGSFAGKRQRSSRPPASPKAVAHAVHHGTGRAAIGSTTRTRAPRRAASRRRGRSALRPSSPSSFTTQPRRIPAPAPGRLSRRRSPAAARPASPSARIRLPSLGGRPAASLDALDIGRARRERPRGAGRRPCRSRGRGRARAAARPAPSASTISRTTRKWSGPKKRAKAARFPAPSKAAPEPIRPRRST